MKLFVPFALFMAVGFILAAGCVATTVKNTVNATTAATFAPVTNTSNPGLNKTIDATANITSDLKGSLKVSICGILYPANLSVFLDNEIVGTVKPTSPLYLMVSEGNHTVMVCESSICKQESVTTRFGKYVTVDFSEQLQKDVEFPNPTAQPTARILEYYRNGNTISVEVEFFNPSTKDLLMSAEVSCGYSYIDDRTSIKMGDSLRGKLVQNVKAGQRIAERLDLNFAGGNSFSYSSPVIEELQVK
ncbi:MAG: hypothetical protein LUQ04_03000 [Methanoregula sp.]|nr:hypothetical protein [Methanoregula sp.]